MSLTKLIPKIASHFDLKTESIISASRKREISEARAIISCLAVNDIGYNSYEVAQALEISRVSAGQCIYRGQKKFFTKIGL